MDWIKELIEGVINNEWAQLISSYFFVVVFIFQNVVMLFLVFWLDRVENRIIKLQEAFEALENTIIENDLKDF